MSSDPSSSNLHKPLAISSNISFGGHRALSKSLSVAELTFLRSQLPEFERLSQGVVRGLAKAFAKERANDFIARFRGNNGVAAPSAEEEPKFKEQIYNWFKNTSGRARRKLKEDEAYPGSRSKSASVAPDKDLHNNDNHAPINLQWDAPNGPISYSDLSISVAITPKSYTPASLPSSPPQVPPIPPTVDINSIRDAFLLSPNCDPHALSGMIQSYVSIHQASSETPLTPVILALFDALSYKLESPPPPAPSGSNQTQTPEFNGPAYRMLDLLREAGTYFPRTLAHAGVSGPLACARAIQMQVRKQSVWHSDSTPPSSPPPHPLDNHNNNNNNNTSQSPATTSIGAEIARIAANRQRRKDFLTWAHIHAAALPLRLMSLHSDESAQAYARSRAFSEMVARDSVWEANEVEWVAGIIVLRSVIRTAASGDSGQLAEYCVLLRHYENRWREIKDETRQAMLLEVLVGAKEDIHVVTNGAISS